MKGREHRISQFADDTTTTLLMCFSERNIRMCMDILGEYHCISGLNLNVDKTKVIKFGMDGESRNVFCKELKLIWTNEFPALGIDYNVK